MRKRKKESQRGPASTKSGKRKKRVVSDFLLASKVAETPHGRDEKEKEKGEPSVLISSLLGEKENREKKSAFPFAFSPSLPSQERGKKLFVRGSGPPPLPS